MELHFKNQKLSLMKQLKRIIFTLLLAGGTYLSSLAQESQYFLHTVEKGQTLTTIASMYGVTKTDIVALNPGSDTKILAGQSLKIPQKKNGQVAGTFHTIQAGETLYRVSTKYNVSTKAICDANPGLSAENFRTGQVIRIPSPESIEQAAADTQTPAAQDTYTVPGPVQSKYKDMHKVERKETIYSISRAYGLTEDELKAANPELKKDGLKRGTFLRIPYPSNQAGAQTTTPATTPSQPTSTYITPPSNSELFSENKEKAEKLSTIKAAIILPFTKEKRMVEYYEGFLIAVDSLKRTGVSIDLYAYNTGEDVASLNTVLAKPELKQMNVIFGPLFTQQISTLATFAKKNEIRLVIPFTSKDSEVFTNPYVYQVNTPQPYLYSEVYEHFTRLFPKVNVIFLESVTIDKDKEEFIKGLKQEFTQKGIPMKSLKETASVAELKGAMESFRENIFIPTSSTETTLTRIIPQLTLLVREVTSGVHLFGYPEWQTHTNEFINNFFELDTYFYTSFYTNNLLPAAINFTNAYHKWYSKEMVSKYPKYGMLGFDTGFFFLKGLSRFGTDLDNNVSRMNLTPIQTGFKFERVNNWGGFVNKKVFFVNFSRNFEVIKLDFE